ncbi:stabilin-1-like [Arapaima gigas]
MNFLIVLGLAVSCAARDTETVPNRCNELSTELFYTQCTSCAASPSMLCPPGSRKTTDDVGSADCRYSVDIGEQTLLLPGCRHTCERTVMVKKCCPNFWGPLCLPCPMWSGRVCNWHGTCMDGLAGNGTCVCKEGVSGLACQECKKNNVYGSNCASECTCYHNGECSSGPHGDGQCYCQPPYTGPMCLTVSPSCANCSAYSYCKGDGKSAECECLPGFRKTGTTCTGDLCSTSVCDPNAECANQEGKNYQCKCKDGYQGNGMVCVPVNPCDTDNGGCPAISTICVYVSPGKSRCECKTGMEGSSPAQGCSLKNACVDGSCHRTAQCQTSLDGIPICSCSKQQIGDGKRCYGNIMERMLELDRDDTLKGRISASITSFEKGCQLILSKKGPLTVFIPLLSLSAAQTVPDSIFCKNHIILSQRLVAEMQSKEHWLLSGKAVRFQNPQRFIITQSPYQDFVVVQSNIPAANGIIHVIDRPLITSYSADSDERISKMTIGDFISSTQDYNRFQSLLDNCGATMPLRGPGPLTVFVPSNDAVDRARDGSIIYMLTQAKHKLQKLLKHHIFSLAAVTTDQLASMSEFQSMAQETVIVNVSSDGRIALSEKGINLESRDIIASNGIIHIIDGVLVPPSIVPILPHRCDVTDSKIVLGTCVQCNHLRDSNCPPGTIELTSHMKDCEYSISLLSSIRSSKGCAKYCNMTRVRPECCKGFYGPDCKPCIGGFEHPCYDKGTCHDGIQGDGSCSCAPGFMGIACHLCSDPNKHGENCDKDCGCVHGKCDNRPGSNGVCRQGSCLEGYSGDFCNLVPSQCSTDSFLHCDHNANCVAGPDGKARQLKYFLNSSCVCKAGFEGDGYSCVLRNPCLEASRGGCDLNAQCVFSGPGNTSCVCNEGWTGDGMACAEIDNCLLSSRGGCHVNANCKPTGPGQNLCTCKTGYMGNGISCDLIDPCRSNNGGCHPLASCTPMENGTRVCRCVSGYVGDGIQCYGDILTELAGRIDILTFYNLIQKSHRFSFEDNITALVPSDNAFKRLSKQNKDFWLDSFRVPFLLRVHFLKGIFSSEDLQQKLHMKLPTLHENTLWEIQNKSGEITVQNATIVTSDIRASNGYIHIINTVLQPPLSDIPPAPPSLLDFLNSSPAFSIFSHALVLYNLTNKIEGKKYTIFIPTNEAVKEYLGQTNATELDEDTIKYHVVVDDQLFPKDLRAGLLKPTLLGPSYQIMFYMGAQNESFANEVLLGGNFSETKNGVVRAIGKILEIHKNFCNREIALKVRGKCGACDDTPKCYLNAKPLEKDFPPNMKPNCKYRTRVGTKRKTIPGCMMDCLRKSMDHFCCPGYFGHTCLKCPGKPDSWCSNHGNCQDGYEGSGKCQCDEGYDGTACETCKPGKYGQDCKSVCNCNHGRCLDGIDGDGSCLCYKGFKGPTCSVEIQNDLCGGTCHEFANCIAGAPGAAATCSCIAGYQGDGITCKEVNPCDSNNGGCSKMANCTKTSPGERNCTCQKGYTGDGLVCQGRCHINNGGCHQKAICLRISHKEVICICETGYNGNGKYCFPANPCRTANGGCSRNAWCEFTGPGNRTCKCRSSYVGDGFTCRGSVNYEILHHSDAVWFNRKLRGSKFNGLSGKGPFTIFIPHADYVQNLTVESWENTRRIDVLLQYHAVGCVQLMLSDLKSSQKIISLSGHPLTITVREGDVYINDEAKIITSDYATSNGVLHFIDKVLFPYDLNNKTKLPPVLLNVTAAADAYGYRIFSKLLQDAGLMDMIENRIHHPFTMLWPKDEVFESFPTERKKWLYSADHKDKLAAYINVHIIRDTKLSAAELPYDDSLRTMYGSTISFSCDRNALGGIVVDDGNAKIIDRHLEFNVGIAHGIDQVLEPPDLGARCDNFTEVKLKGRCGSCAFTPSCPYGMSYLGETNACTYNRYSSLPFYRRRFYDVYNFGSAYRYGNRQYGCQKQCGKANWVPQCCKNHYGQNCHVCPGGLEAPCSHHGTCDDGKRGTGNCVCYTGFTGTACELCATNHFGPNCSACACTNHGKCSDGLDGDGSCFCEEGWTGDQCQYKLGEKPVCSPECHPNAVCQLGNICQCESLYEGDGRNCTAPDLCSEYNGGCDAHANCTQVGVKVTCSCLPGYTGDGVSCSAINLCVQEPNGGCSDFAECIFTGPNKRQCKCLPGYVGNGVQCLEKVVPPVDRCLENNGGCDPNAICKDLHFHDNTVGVFHLRSPAGKYKFNYTDAIAACEAEQAMLANFKHLSNAQQLGMHLCVAGWLDEANVGYPIIYPSAKCGDNHVGIVTYNNPVPTTSMFDAYCYRMKDVSCECGPEYVGDGYFCNGDLASIVATNANFSTFYSILLNYSNLAEGRDFVDILSTRSTSITLFVPQNSGFYPNETLSGRDVEYHISTSVHFYNNLSHNSIIPSRLGYNLSVMVSSPSAVSQPSKLVNKRLIVDWDIPAINGIIHIIEGPLKAPPPPVLPHEGPNSHTHPHKTAVASVLVIVLVAALVAGLVFYIFRHKKDPFRFQYFRENESEDSKLGGEGNPALVSIPNPLYSGSSTAMEPFDVSEDCNFS